MLEVIEYRGLLPVETFLGFEHASNDVFTILVKAFTYVLHVDAPERVAAVKQVLQSRLAKALWKRGQRLITHVSEDVICVPLKAFDGQFGVCLVSSP